MTTLYLPSDYNEVNEAEREWEENDGKRRIEMKWYKNKVWTGNNIGEEGVRMVSEGLKSNSTLTKLNLEGDEERRNNK